MLLSSPYQLWASVKYFDVDIDLDLSIYTRDDQKVLQDTRPILFNIISIQDNALSLSLFELFYPFKMEGLFLVPRVLVYCLYDAFIASILCTTKMGFQFWEQIEVRRSHIRRIWGMRKYFKST